jgi:hypothetical protein
MLGTFRRRHAQVTTGMDMAKRVTPGKTDGGTGKERRKQRKQKESKKR